MIARWWHATIAALVVCAVAVQLVVAARLSGSPPDVTSGVLRGSSFLGRIIRVFSFFTIESNVLSAIVSAQLALRPARDGAGWRILRITALCAITVTGVVYSAVLADIHEPARGAETFVNTIVHFVVPIMMVLGWLAFGPRPRIDRTALVWSLAFPVAWLAYTLVRGAIWSWYPYPFLDAADHGYPRVLLNCVLVTVLFAIVTAVFAAGDRALPAVPPWPDAHRHT